MSNLVRSSAVQIAAVEETVAGTTPSNPVFQVWRFTSESVNFSPETSENNEMGLEGRSQYPDDVTSLTIGGDINFNLAKFNALEEAIAGIMASPWGELPSTGAVGGGIEDTDRVTIGETTKTFTIEKRIPTPDGLGFEYQWYRGVTYNALTLSVTPGEKITGTVSLVAGQPALGNTAIAGATYVAPASGANFFAPKVLTVDIGSMTKASHCWTSLDLSFDSGNEGVQCIGFEGEKGVYLGMLQASISGEVYFADQDLLQAMLDDTIFGDGTITLENADNDIYRFDLYDLKVVSTELSAGSSTEALSIPVELQPSPINVGTLVDPWNASAIISLKDTDPTVRPT